MAITHPYLYNFVHYTESERFDCPDRFFFYVAGYWKSCLNSTSDVKELMPEFFTGPEICLSTKKFISRGNTK